jgi:hypothetical protein
MPEEGRRYPNQRAVGKLNLSKLNYINCLLVHHDFMIPGLYKTAGNVLQLFASFDKKVVALRNLDRDTLSGVAGPDVQARISRAAVNGKEVEVGMEPSENGVFLPIPFKVGGSWCEKMGPVIS